MKKMFALIFMTTVFTAFMVAGGQQDTTSVDEVVELKMYLLGDTVPDYDMMLEELNGKMAGDIGATLSVNFTTWVDWQTKLRLILASGEDVDLVHMAPWGIYNEQAQSGNLMDLQALAPEYAKETWSSYSPAILKQAEVNGSVYMLPFNFTEPMGQGILYRKDLAIKNGLDKVDSIDSFISYLHLVKENEDMIPYNAGEFDLNVWADQFMTMHDSAPQEAVRYLLTNNEGVIATVNYSDPETIIYDFETQNYKDAIANSREMYLAGLMPRNILSNTIGSRESFLAGKSAITSLNPLNANEEYAKLKESHPDWELGYWMPMASFDSFEKASAINNGMSIPAASKNPIKALMLLEKLHQDQSYHDLTTYGIKGVHWDLDSNNEIMTPAGLNLADSGFPWDKPCPWGWREEKFYRLNVLKSSTVWNEVKDAQITLNEIGVDAKWTNFSFNKSSVSTEISALNTVRSGLFSALIWGVVDPAEEYENLLKEYDRAGIETVKQELEKQWKAYLAENK